VPYLRTDVSEIVIFGYVIFFFIFSVGYLLGDQVYIHVIYRYTFAYIM